VLFKEFQSIELSLLNFIKMSLLILTHWTHVNV